MTLQAVVKFLLPLRSKIPFQRNKNLSIILIIRVWIMHDPCREQGAINNPIRWTCYSDTASTEIFVGVSVDFIHDHILFNFGSFIFHGRVLENAAWQVFAPWPPGSRWILKWGYVRVPFSVWLQNTDLFSLLFRWTKNKADCQVQGRVLGLKIWNVCWY